MSTVVHRPEPITREGHQRLQAELEQLVALTRRPVEDGRDDPEMVERRIAELQTALAYATVVEPPPEGVAGIGRRVSVRFASQSTPVEYHLVSTFEADAASRRIPVSSPIGEALVGRVAGDRVEVETPGGMRRLEVLTVS